MRKDGPSFGEKERREANDAQVLTFFSAYDPTWRLAKLLMIRSLLKDRESVRAELEASGLQGLDDAKVYGPLTNGLLFSAVAELMMLVEDLLALIKFSRSREHFARSLVHYSAGEVTNLVGTLKSASDERLRSAFMVPRAELLEGNRGDTPLEEVRPPYLKEPPPCSARFGSCPGSTSATRPTTASTSMASPLHFSRLVVRCGLKPWRSGSDR